MNGEGPGRGVMPECAESLKPRPKGTCTPLMRGGSRAPSLALPSLGTVVAGGLALPSLGTVVAGEGWAAAGQPGRYN